MEEDPFALTSQELETKMMMTVLLVVLPKTKCLEAHASFGTNTTNTTNCGSQNHLWREMADVWLRIS